MTENYLVYPCAVMKLTQNYRQGNHAKHYNGAPRDYPIDEAGADAGRSWFVCPCDEMRVVRLYGVGAAGVNTLWLESVGEVVMPCGRGVITLMVEHVEDEDMRALRQGQVFRRGQRMFREGKDGAAGNHFHISVGAGRLRDTGWVQNDQKAWVIATEGAALPPEFAFFLDGTRVLQDGGLHFTKLPKEGKTMDNTADAYAVQAVEWAQKQGILRGDEQGNLRLHEPVTRQDAAVMLWRYEQMEEKRRNNG